MRGVVAMAKTAGRRAGHVGQPVLHRHRARLAAAAPTTRCWAASIGADDAVRRIARSTTDPVTEMPLDPVVIESVRIQRP